MTQIILSGALGTMGRAVASLAADRDGCRIAAGIDPAASGGEEGRSPLEGTFPLFPSPETCTVTDGVIVDFSHPSALDGILRFALAHSLPAVICTTGLEESQIASLHEAAKRIPVFFSANMSLGVNLMAALCEKAAMVLDGAFDIEIVEKHHNRKIDAPSGTALMLADRISGVLREKPQYVYDRHSERRRRRKNEIGLHAVRGGTIVGEHEVIFAGVDEVLTISHSAASKQVFAAGALSAAEFLCSEPAGLYDMRDLV